MNNIIISPDLMQEYVLSMHDNLKLLDRILENFGEFAKASDDYGHLETLAHQQSGNAVYFGFSDLGDTAHYVKVLLTSESLNEFALYKGLLRWRAALLVSLGG